ncbi:hypothetical protein POM88_040141 [Heracleum sosnowskyi]|uniref:Uncharacterized protein n=1 Tax=Heracleum sosnowskyi TaxID=360622 RepID=A0AAD8HBQ1_9APIA|nr:hypothetical protein POM88_040141 [Heracleum sosnowskyi]
MEEAVAESAGAGAGGWEKWTAASVIQLATGVYSYRRVRSGECRLMPLKAFGIASLFVGAGFTSVFAVVAANGIHSVNDFMEVGANIRSSLGARPRAHDERS